MYAVIATGGKQYRVSEGQLLKVEKLNTESGNGLTFDQVLLIANGEDVKVGAPYLKGAKVTAEVVTHGRAAQDQYH